MLDNLHPAAHRERPGDLDPRAEVTWGDVRDETVTALRYHNVYGPRMPCDTPTPALSSTRRPRGRAPWPERHGRP